MRYLIVIGFLAACSAPAYVPGQRQPPPAAGDLTHAERRIVAKDGLELFSQSWHPREAAKAALVVVHGLKDYSDRYAPLAADLVKQGVAVYTFDLRGHGDSAGDRVWVESFDDYVTDLAQVVDDVRNREPGKPVFVFGHSMGGAIATLYALGDPSLRGVILSGAALKPGADVSPFLISLTSFLSSIAPRLAVLNLPNEKFSRDPKVVAAMQQDPLVYEGAGPAQTAAELLRALERIQAEMTKFAPPVLILHAGDDLLTNPDGSRELHARAISADKTLKIYPGLYHDLLHEPESAQVRADITSWIAAHTTTP